MDSRSFFTRLLDNPLRGSKRRSVQSLDQPANRRVLWMEALEQRRMLATIVVTTDADTLTPGFKTLREAVAEANLTTAPDVITFSFGSPGAKTIQLLSDGHLEVTNPLEIQGTGRTNLTIRPYAGAPGVLEDGVGAFYVPHGGLTLKDLRIAGGDVWLGSLFPSMVQALDFDGLPGHIPLSIINVDIIGNRGDAVTSDYTVTIQNSNLSNNTGMGVAAGFGDGKTLIEASVINGNGTGGVSSKADIDILHSTIDANGGGGVYIAESYSERLYVEIENSSISKNAGTGVQIHTSAGHTPGTVTIEKTTLSDNGGKGLHFYGGNAGPDDLGLLTVLDSTIARNQFGGVLIDLGAASLVAASITNSTISGNTTVGVGGGIEVDSGGYLDLVLTNVTITGNKANYESNPDFNPLDPTPDPETLLGGGGIWIEDYDNPSVTGFPEFVRTFIRNSIVAGNTNQLGKPDNIAAVLVPYHPTTKEPWVLSTSESHHNLIGSGNTARWNLQNGLNGNKIGTLYDDPKLTPLANFGGVTLTHAPLYGSPAIDAGDNTLAGSFDQRGTPFNRIKDSDGNSTSVIDIGAFEHQRGAFVVTNTNSSGSGSLRQAILDAKAVETTTGWNHVIFNLPGASPHVINISPSGTLVVNSNLQVAGPSAAQLSISGGNSSRVITASQTTAFSSPGFVMFNDVTITQGNTDKNGGGILSTVQLGLDAVEIVGNTTSGSGGGLYHTGSALHITRSTIVGNTATGSGGGMQIQNAVATIDRSTISGNQGASGGGAFISAGVSTITFKNSTLTANHSTTKLGGGIYNQDPATAGTKQLPPWAVVRLDNTIVVGNTNPYIGQKNLDGQFDANSSYNLVGNSGAGIGLTHGLNGNQLGVTPAQAALGLLANNGGSTRTHALLSGSFALDKGSDLIAGSKDQRGNPRPIDLISVPDGSGGTADIGAYEASGISSLAASGVAMVPSHSGLAGLNGVGLGDGISGPTRTTDRVSRAGSQSPKIDASQGAPTSLGSDIRPSMRDPSATVFDIETETRVDYWIDEKGLELDRDAVELAFDNY